MLPERIEAARLPRLAADGANARWGFGPGRFARLDRLRAPGGQLALDVTVRLEQGAGDRPELVITAGGVVELVCQRCLEPCPWQVDVEARLAVLGSEAEAEGLEAPLDVVVCGGAELDLVEVIEDELLAAMPLSPRHPPGACATAVPGDSVARNRPFAVLPGLLARDEQSTD